MPKDWTPEDIEAARQADRREHATMVACIYGEPVAKWGGFRLIISCQPCDRTAESPVHEVKVTHGPTLWADFIGRLRCQSCGAPPTAVRLKHHVADWWLVGERPVR